MIDTSQSATNHDIIHFLWKVLHASRNVLVGSWTTWNVQKSVLRNERTPYNDWNWIFSRKLLYFFQRAFLSIFMNEGRFVPDIIMDNHRIKFLAQTSSSYCVWNFVKVDQIFFILAQTSSSYVCETLRRLIKYLWLEMACTLNLLVSDWWKTQTLQLYICVCTCF